MFWVRTRTHRKLSYISTPKVFLGKRSWKPQKTSNTKSTSEDKNFRISSKGLFSLEKHCNKPQILFKLRDQIESSISCRPLPTNINALTFTHELFYSLKIPFFFSLSFTVVTFRWDAAMKKKLTSMASKLKHNA